MATVLGRRQAGGPQPDRPPPWQRIVGIAVPVAAVGILAALKPEVVRGTFSSAESMLRVGAVIAGWVLFSWLMRRIVPNTVVRTAVIAVPATLLLWMNVAPYFDDDVKVAGRFPESFTTAGGAPAPGALPGTTPPGEEASAPAPVPVPSQPVQLSTGRFRGLDGHRGSGEASLFRQPDGSHVVAFRNLSVSSVPDPVVYLVPGSDQEGIDGAVRLGRFEAGRDAYTVPAGFDVDRALTVMIWCQRFSVPVAGASQSPT
ncbi:MAG TPA: DM13 domain-containing protein [Acidimicrobiales bacterium]|nr:DM13 domain-containing protein [Acidimicrobiales bacterium]